MKHKIIQTENYLLIIDDLEINQYDFIYKLSNGEQDIANDEWDNDVHNDWKKIIAHLPLNNSPILNGVDLLPPIFIHYENGIEEYEKSCNQLYKEWLVIGYKSGYNKHAEKYKYTEEDLRKVIDMARKDFDEEGYLIDRLTEDEIIQSLQQPKMPVGFDVITIDNLEETTINSQGLTQWVGKYIY